jgi:hypothetical protein
MFRLHRVVVFVGGGTQSTPFTKHLPPKSGHVYRNVPLASINELHQHTQMTEGRQSKGLPLVDVMWLLWLGIRIK